MSVLKVPDPNIQDAGDIDKNTPTQCDMQSEAYYYLVIIYHIWKWIYSFLSTSFADIVTINADQIG